MPIVMPPEPDPPAEAELAPALGSSEPPPPPQAVRARAAARVRAMPALRVPRMVSPCCRSPDGERWWVVLRSVAEQLGEEVLRPVGPWVGEELLGCCLLDDL